MKAELLKLASELIGSNFSLDRTDYSFKISNKFLLELEKCNDKQMRIAREIARIARLK